MSAPGPLTRIEFDGPVTCGPGLGAVGLTLAGMQRGSPLAAHLALVDAADVAGLPALLHEVRLCEQECAAAPARRCFELSAREARRELHARGIQLHCDASRDFFRAVPPIAVPLVRRVAWHMLLALLRMPGIVWLLKQREST